MPRADERYVAALPLTLKEKLRTADLAGVGIAIVPEGVARGNQDVAVREIEVKVKREVGLAYRASVPLADALKDLVAKLQKQRAKPSLNKPSLAKPSLTMPARAARQHLARKDSGRRR
jgi:hypothetical protein